MNPAFGNHHGCIVVRIVRMSAALADEIGLSLPIVRGSECADGTFLRTGSVGDQDDQFAGSQGFVAREGDHLAPGRSQDGSVEPGFGAGAIGQKVPLSVLLRFRATRHLLNRQILKRIEIVGGVDNERMAGLVRVFLPYVLFVLLIVGDLAIRFLLVFRALFAPRGLALPLRVSAAMFFDAFFLHGKQIVSLPVGCHQRFGHPTVPAQRAFGELLGGAMAQVLRDALYGRIGVLAGKGDDRILCRKRDPPLTGFDGDVNGCGNGMGAMCGVGNGAHWKFVGADRQGIPGDRSACRLHLRDEREQLLGNPDRLPPGFLVEFRTSPKFLKEPLVSIGEFGSSIAQDLGWDVSEKCGRVTDKSAVLLIVRNFHAHGSDHPPLKAAKIAIFLHFGVVDHPLAPDPAE